MTRNSESPTALFAPPRVVAEAAADGVLTLRSAEPLGAYPPSVVHSVRATVV
jgi:hypothetical protein